MLSGSKILYHHVDLGEITATDYIEIEVEDCDECTATFSFYVISGSNLSQVHMVVENLGATEASPMKEDVTVS